MSKRRPNVVVFFVDQQRADVTGVHGCPLDLTPNFDRLARAGTDVHRAFTCQPLCGPARACLQTGMYATTHGSVTNNIPLDAALPNLAGCFRGAGYHTGYIGKWHLRGGGHERQAVPREAPEGRGNYESWLACEALEFSEHELCTVLYDQEDRPVRLPGYRSDAVADAMIRHIADRALQDGDRPFLLVGSFIEPHHQNDTDSYPAPPGYEERYRGGWCPPDLMALGGSTAQHWAGYCGMVKRLDEGLGRVVEALESLEILEETIVLFLSDHGCHFKTRNGEYKRSGHEASVRIPVMLHGGMFTGGGRVGRLVSLVDLPPTLLEACGIAVPGTMQGRSIVPLVRRDVQASEDWPDSVYVQISESTLARAVRTHRWKYIVNNSAVSAHAPTAEVYHEAELYDLKYDPYELTNLIDAASHAEMRAEMRERLKQWQARVGEPRAEIVPAVAQPSGQRAAAAERG